VVRIQQKHEEIALKNAKSKKEKLFLEKESRMSNLKVKTKTSKLMYCFKNN